MVRQRSCEPPCELRIVAVAGEGEEVECAPRKPERRRARHTRFEALGVRERLPPLDRRPCPFVQRRKRRLGSAHERPDDPHVEGKTG